ncbi:CBS domain-containing protein [Pelagibius marinus]|uniref:CBS domain-containing protein n=1 Tax=Pelagibius marinus TaxID=2762760 RepID=UPI001872D980|nr:CBS domain-containing protein [Pelagibius marinus]
MMIKDLLQKQRGTEATIGAQAKVAEAAALLAAQHIDVVVVCDSEHRVLGVVTESDILGDIVNCKGGAYLCNAPVSKIMVQEVASCSRKDDLDDVRAMMIERGLRRVPVVDGDGRLIGLVSLRELLLHQYQAAEIEEGDLEHYFFGVGYQ